MIIYTSCFGGYDNLYPSADIRYDEVYNPYSGSSGHLSDRLKAKMYKILNPDCLDLWIDANIEISYRDDFEKEFKGDFCVFKHPFNKSVGEELILCNKIGYVNNHEVDKIKELYHSAGLNVDTTPVYAGEVIYRTRKAEELNRHWWSLICEYSFRDQLTLPYAINQINDIDIHIIKLDIYNNSLMKVNKHK